MRPWLALLIFLVPAQATAMTCRIALTLALDVSSSVDEQEYRIQIEGVAQALEDARVRRALFQIPGAYVALQVFEWSGVGDQTIVVDWTPVRSAEDLDRMAASIRAHQRSVHNAATGLGRALSFALDQLGQVPDCGFHKIDISGDGQSNVGVPPQQLYAIADFGEVTVNGLAILSDERALGRYYSYFVIRGPGAFLEVADSFEAYPAAIKRKLIKELGVARLGMR
ncbi:MAG: DUF1194 domain-containing protein [Pseudomonadota bacterium]